MGDNRFNGSVLSLGILVCILCTNSKEYGLERQRPKYACKSVDPKFDQHVGSFEQSDNRNCDKNVNRQSDTED